MNYLGLLLGYMVLRPLLTLAEELPRAIAMTRWQGRFPVTFFWGSWGHQGGWSARLGSIILRFHPMGLLLRGGLSDTLSKPNSAEFDWWCRIPIGVSALAATLSAWLAVGSILPWTEGRLLAGMALLLSLSDFISHAWIRQEPMPLNCGMCWMGNGATLAKKRQYAPFGHDYLLGLHAYLRDDYQTALQHWDELAKSHSKDPEVLEEAAYASWVSGNTPKPFEFFRSLGSEFRASPTFRCIMSMALAQNGQMDEAFGEVNMALKMAPGNPMARNLRGWLYMQQKDFTSAEPDFREASKSSEYATAWANLAQCRMEMGQWGQAQMDLQRAMELQPFDLGSMETLQEIQKRTGKEEQASRTQQMLELLHKNSPNT
jgi:Flp pilus assembly protein TadD